MDFRNASPVQLQTGLTRISLLSLAVLVNLPSLDTPVSHIMLVDRLRSHSELVDLEKNGSVAVSAELVNRDDDLWSTTHKLWKIEGWRGFVKGWMPSTVLMLSSVAVGLTVDNVLHKVIATRRTGVWRMMNLSLVHILKSLIIAVLSAPALILRTRLRLSPASRTTKQETRYLFFRLSIAEWFSSQVVVPSFFYNLINDVIWTQLGTRNSPPGLNLLMGSSAWSRAVKPMQALGSIILANTLSFPFLRSQELGALKLKPLEEPAIHITDYEGLAHEIVLDSAWNGVGAKIRQCLLLLPSLLLSAFIP